MKLTPLDIHHKEFRHSLRGYSEEQVDAFLDEVADEFERLFKENIDLNEKLEAAREKLREYEQLEKTVHNTMVAAQKSAEDIVENATKEADLTRKDAELRAKEIIHEALGLKQKTQNELMRIKEAETDFRQAFRALLERHLSGLQEIPVPEEVAGMAAVAATADDIVASMASIREPEPASAAPAAPPAAEAPRSAAPESAPGPEPAAVATPEQAEAPAEIVSPPAEVAPQAPQAAPVPEPQGLLGEEPPQSGFVTSIQLGELDDTGITDEEPAFVDPSSFELPTFDSLGERDDELDIEEID